MPTLVSFRADVPHAPTKSTLHTKTRRRRKPYLHQEHYLCDFYENIWTKTAPPQEREIPGALPVIQHGSKTKTLPITKSKQRKDEHQQFVDIAQVAFALATTAVYREGYQPTSQSEVSLNIWGMTLPSDGYESIDGSDQASEAFDELKKPTNGTSGARIQNLRTATGIILKPTGAKPRQSTITEESRDSLAPTHDGDDRTSMATTDIDGDVNHKSRPEFVKPGRGRMRGENGSSAKMDMDIEMPPLSVDVAIPAPSKMNGSIVFSTVFMGRGEWGWSIRFLLGLHEPVRHALYVMDRFLAQCQEQKQRVDVLDAHTREFFVWFNAYFVEYLTTQHEIMVRVLMPLVKIPYMTEREMTHAYDDIYHALAQIQAQERLLQSSPSQQEHAAWLLRLDLLQKCIRSLNMTVYAVLNLEEKTMHSALAESFPEKAFRSFVLPRVFRVIKAKKVVVPWMIERSKVWGGEAERQSFQGMLPFSSRFLYKKVWRPYFDSNVAVAISNLDEWDTDRIDRRHERHDAAGCTIQ